MYIVIIDKKKFNIEVHSLQQWESCETNQFFLINLLGRQVGHHKLPNKLVNKVSILVENLHINLYIYI